MGEGGRGGLRWECAGCWSCCVGVRRAGVVKAGRGGVKEEGLSLSPFPRGVLVSSRASASTLPSTLLFNSSPSMRYCVQEFTIVPSRPFPQRKPSDFAPEPQKRKSRKVRTAHSRVPRTKTDPLQASDVRPAYSTPYSRLRSSPTNPRTKSAPTPHEKQKGRRTLPQTNLVPCSLPSVYLLHILCSADPSTLGCKAGSAKMRERRRSERTPQKKTPVSVAGCFSAMD